MSQEARHVNNQSRTAGEPQRGATGCFHCPQIFIKIHIYVESIKSQEFVMLSFRPLPSTLPSPPASWADIQAPLLHSRIHSFPPQDLPCARHAVLSSRDTMVHKKMSLSSLPSEGRRHKLVKMLTIRQEETMK